VGVGRRESSPAGAEQKKGNVVGAWVVGGMMSPPSCLLPGYLRSWYPCTTHHTGFGVRMSICSSWPSCKAFGSLNFLPLLC